jgi:hypothetical protein
MIVLRIWIATGVEEWSQWREVTAPHLYGRARISWSETQLKFCEFRFFFFILKSHDTESACCTQSRERARHLSVLIVRRQRHDGACGGDGTQNKGRVVIGNCFVLKMAPNRPKPAVFFY